MGKRIDWIKAGLSKGYTFDGCTSVPDLNFGHCCDRHDYHYQDKELSRKQADNLLFKCMSNGSWKRNWRGKLLAPVYWLGVRVFGGNYWNRKQNENLSGFHDSNAA